MPLEEVLGRALPVRLQNWLRDHPRFGRAVDASSLALGGLAALFHDRSLAWRFLSQDKVQRDLAYGPHARHRLDLYERGGSRALRTVVVLVHGGAWGMGSKMLYRLHARRLQDEGHCVAVLNYRLYPWASSDVQAQDIRLALRWLGEQADELGFAADQVFVLAHSSGAHISLLGAIKAAQRDEPPLCAGMVLMSGVYDIAAHYEFERGRNVHELSFMKPANSAPGASHPEAQMGFAERSPVSILRGLQPEEALRVRQALPPLLVLHGTRDTTVPHSSSEALHAALESVGVRATTHFLDSHDHTDIHLEFMLGRGEAVLSLLEQFMEDPGALPVAAAPRPRL